MLTLSYLQTARAREKTGERGRAGSKEDRENKAKDRGNYGTTWHING